MNGHADEELEWDGPTRRVSVEVRLGVMCAEVVIVVTGDREVV